MKNTPSPVLDLSAQLVDLGLERDNLVVKIKEYERLLSLDPQKLLQYAEKIDAVFYQMSVDLTKIIYLNPASENVLEKSRDSLYKDPALWFDSIHPEDRLKVKNTLLGMSKNTNPECLLEYRFKRSDGSIFYMFDRAVLVKDKMGKPDSIIGIAANMTNYVKIQKYQLIYQQIIFAIKDNKSIELVLDSILKITCHTFDWDVGEFWVFDADIKSFYCVTVYHKFAKELTEFYEMSRRLVMGKAAGYQGYIAKQSAPVYIHDFKEHKEYYQGDLAEKAGINTAFGLPIMFNKKLIGIMNFFSREPKSENNEEVHIMQWVSDMLGQIIQHNMSNDKLLYITKHDDLTGLLNRNGLEKSLNNKIESAGTHVIGIIMIDLDRFGLINESSGFDVGDIFLKELALKFKEDVSDIVHVIANIGGDKYVFITDYLASPEKIKFIIDRIMISLRQPFIIKDHEINLTASVGVSVYPYDGLDTSTLLKNADIALSHVKLQGGNTIQFCTQTMQETISNAMKIENGLRHALVQHQLKLYYQPKVDLRTGEIVGIEALLRWQDPEYGLRLPESFLSIAEDSDLIVYIGEWVLMEVCYHFPLADLKLPVAVNLSARQLKKQYNLVKFIMELTSKLSIDPHLLELEVTESQLMKDPVQAAEVLLPLKQIGISLALDDFGTGYSSFDYVRRFKTDRLKIDKSFIDGMSTDDGSAAIVKAMIVLGQALRIKVIAEGVETVEQLKFLIQEGCDEMQGFYFSKPLPIYELKALLASGAKLKFPD